MAQWLKCLLCQASLKPSTGKAERDAGQSIWPMNALQMHGETLSQTRLNGEGHLTLTSGLNGRLIHKHSPYIPFRKQLRLGLERQLNG